MVQVQDCTPCLPSSKNLQSLSASTFFLSLCSLFTSEITMTHCWCSSLESRAVSCLGRLGSREASDSTQALTRSYRAYRLLHSWPSDSLLARIAFHRQFPENQRMRIFSGARILLKPSRTDSHFAALNQKIRS